MSDDTYKKAVGRYLVGGVAAAGLTLLAYFTITDHWYNTAAAAAALILMLGFIQLVVQLIFFLHFGQEKGPRWKTYSFLFAVVMIMVVVVGSLWVMMNLNYNMGMSPDDMLKYMIDQNKKGF